MKKQFFTRLAALLTAALLFALPVALAEAAPDVETGAVDQCPPERGDIALDVAVDPMAPPATEAGDTGLWVEYASEAEQAAVELGEIELPTDGEDGTARAAAGDETVLARLWTEPGYAAVADGAQVYADAALQGLYGAFPKGATVYVEALQDGGALLRIRFDTDGARAWGEAIPTGYVLAGDTLPLNAQETAALTAALGADPRTRKAGDAPVPLAAFDAQAHAVSTGADSEDAGESGDGAEAQAAEPLIQGLGVYARTQEEIQAFADANPSYTAQLNIYTKAATDDPYTVGYLSDVNQRSALNLLNQVRYIAGLDGNLTLLPEREEMEAATALVLRLFGGLSHYPPRAEALSDAQYDALYSLGYAGASRSNIAMGYTATSAILAYMADSDEDNIAKVGHRRWILNPPLGQTVMGANGRFSAMYVHDQSAPGGQTRVAWPAQQMPVQYFSAEDPWSVSFGTVLDASQIQVDLVRQWDGKTWHFSETASDGFFVVNNQAYAQRGCVIFRPEGLDGVMIGDAFNVSITDGANNTVTRYTVNFFSLNTAASAPLSRPQVTAVKTDAGNVIQWSAVERAVGYYVCRRTMENTSLYAIIADVEGETRYVDRAVDDDQVYYYQVYPHTNCVTCPLMSGVKATAPLPDKIRLSPGDTPRVYVDDTLQLEALLEPVYAESGLFWNSTNEYVAEVDQSGLVKAKHTGVTTISATTDNEKTAKVKVRVVARPISLKGATVTAADRTWTGKSLKTAVTVKVGGKTLAEGTDYTVAYTGNKAVGKARVTVTGIGKYADAKKASFCILPPKVSGLKLQAGAGKLTVTWKKGSGVNGYQLQYGTRKSLSGGTRITVAKPKAVSRTIRSLKSGVKYYVRVRSYKTVNGKKYYSKWSDTKSARTE